MTQKEAQARNYKILQIRGFIPRLPQIIPLDIQKKLGTKKIDKINELSKEIMDAINESKKIRFVCENCAKPNETKLTKNKKAWKCDVCNSWTPEHLYIAKKEIT